MITVRIPIALERRILESTDSNPELSEIRELINRAKEGKKAASEVPGLSFKAIIECLTEGLGSRLLLPPKPSPAWTIRIVLKVKELGLDADQLRVLGHTTARDWRGGVEADSILRNALKLLSGEYSNGRVSSKDNGLDGDSSNIRIGR